MSDEAALRARIAKNKRWYLTHAALNATLHLVGGLVACVAIGGAAALMVRAFLVGWGLVW